MPMNKKKCSLPKSHDVNQHLPAQSICSRQRSKLMTQPCRQYFNSYGLQAKALFSRSLACCAQCYFLNIIFITAPFPIAYNNYSIPQCCFILQAHRAAFLFLLHYIFVPNPDMPAHFISRFVLLISGLALMAFGVVLSIHSNLETSPISSVPYSFCFMLERSIGTLTVLMDILMIALHMISLGKKFQWHQ